MSEPVPRMRMFAGPNGSGKSSLKTLLNRKLLGTYINPDEIEATMRADSQIDLRDFGANGSGDDILAFLGESSLIKSAGLRDLVDTMSMSGDKLLLGEMPANSYLASVISDFVRHRLLEQGGTFTFETVMSHPGKVALLKHAQQLGYRT